MSIVSSIVGLFVKNGPHVADVITSFANYGKMMRSMLDELPAAEREVQAAMTALEQAVTQGASAFAKLDPKAAATITKAVQPLVEHAKAAPVAAKK